MLSETYVRLVLAIAPLMVCLAWSAEQRTSSKARVRISLGCALLFGLGVFVPPLAGWSVLPWLACSLERALRQLLVFRSGRPDLARWANLAAHLYLPVGAIWALFYQIGFQPLGFASVIVLLTGVHFHYAGFALPWLTSRLSQAGLAAALAMRVATWGVILGVPLVAIGITGSQLDLPNWVETVAVTILALAAFAVAHGYLRWAGQVQGAPRWLFLVGGLALAGGMVLALLYGWRYRFPIEWVTIPAMYTLHGTLNSWGFCLPAILGNKLLAGNAPKGEGDPSVENSPGA